MERKLPFISIIVPTRNRPKQLVSCLHSMAGLEYPRDLFEIIVVADGCPIPPTEQLALPDDTLDMTILTQTHAGPAAARNHGARHAKGEYLLFTDDDCLPSSVWLAKLAEAALVNPDCGIGGRTVNALPSNLYSSASHFLMDFLYGFYNTLPDGACFFASNNIAVPAALFRAVGGFSEKYRLAAGEDRDFCRQWRKNGYRLVYAPEAIVRHAHHLTLAGFLLQQFNYGRGSFLYHHTEKTVNRHRAGFEPPSFYTRLLTYPFSHAVGMRKISIAGLFLLSQIAVTAGLLREAVAYGRKNLADG